MDHTEHKHTEQQLREFAHFLEAGPTVAFVWRDEPGWPVSFVTENVEDLCGYTALDFISGKIAYEQIVHPEDIDRVAQERVQHAGDSSITRFRHEPYRIITKHRRIKWVEDRTAISRNGDGRVTQFHGIVIDITALQSTREFLSTLLLNVNGFAYRCANDADWTMQFVSRGCLELTGYDPEELIGNKTTSFAQLIHPEDRTAVWTQVQSALAGNCPFRLNYRIVTAGGQTRWVWEQGRAVHDVTMNGALHLEGFIMDVTELMKAKVEVEKSKERIQLLADILEHSSQPFGVGLPDGRFGACNASFCSITGYSERELSRMDWNDLTPPEWREIERDKLVELVRTGIPVRYQKEYFRKDGSRVPIELLVHVMRDDNGRAIFYYAFVTDLTDRKKEDAEKEKLRQQLLQSQKMESIGQLAGGIAHDFNNMLAVILGNAELLCMKKGPDNPDYSEIREIINAAKRSRDMTLQLLTFARRGKLDARNIDPAETIRAVAGILTRSLPKKIQIHTDISPGLKILGDATQVYQALVNVCNNAADAMPDGGTLTIECGPAHNIQGQCPVCGKQYMGPYCRIRVCDTGIGMPADMLSKIVEPFYTTKGVGKGTGLGLSVTHGIVQNHNGHLHFSSEQGKGTRVDLLLPLSSTSAAPMESEDEQRVETIPSGTGGILIVDDEEAVLSATSRILESAGYDPVSAISGPDAIALFRNRRQQIRAVILDLMMPDMDGAQVFHELKKIDPDVKVILASGYSIDGQAGDLMTQGIRTFIQKPFTTAILCRALHDILNPDK